MQHWLTPNKLSVYELYFHILIYAIYTDGRPLVIELNVKKIFRIYTSLITETQPHSRSQIQVLDKLPELMPEAVGAVSVVVGSIIAEVVEAVVDSADVGAAVMVLKVVVDLDVVGAALREVVVEPIIEQINWQSFGKQQKYSLHTCALEMCMVMGNDWVSSCRTGFKAMGMGIKLRELEIFPIVAVFDKTHII